MAGGHTYSAIFYGHFLAFHFSPAYSLFICVVTNDADITCDIFWGALVINGPKSPSEANRWENTCSLTQPTYLLREMEE